MKLEPQIGIYVVNFYLTKKIFTGYRNLNFIRFILKNINNLRVVHDFRQNLNFKR